MLPLHAALSQGASLPVVQLLVTTYPQALQLRDGQGLLPIEINATYGAHSSPAVAEFLRLANENLDEVSRGCDLLSPS
jgi:hypothetical protein